MNVAQGRLVDQILTASIMTRNLTYAAERAIPTVQVQKDRIEIPIWGSEHLELDIVGATRTPGTNFQTFNPTLSTSACQLVEYGEEMVFPIEFNQVFDQNVAIGEAYSIQLQDRMLTLNEALAHVQLGTVANFGGQMTPNPHWDAANSTAITDIRNAIAAVYTQSGCVANKIVFAYNAWNAFLMSAEMLAWRNTATFGVPAEVAIAMYFGVEEVIVSKANYMLGGVLTPMSNEWCVVMYQPRTPSQFANGWSYKFQQNSYPVIERYIDDARRATILRYVCYQVFATVNAQCAYIIQDVLT